MMKRVSTILAIISLTGSAAIATAAVTLTDLMQTSRMTVVKVDRVTGQFLCAEHNKWTAVARGDLVQVAAGDIVRVERGEGRARLTVLRTAAEELTSPER
jgi:hypothetical protein